MGDVKTLQLGGHGLEPLRISRMLSKLRLMVAECPARHGAFISVVYVEVDSIGEIRNSYVPGGILSSSRIG